MTHLPEEKPVQSVEGISTIRARISHAFTKLTPKHWFTGAIALLVLTSGAVWWYASGQMFLPSAEEPRYTAVDALIAETVSKSATLAIYPPPGTNLVEAKAGITFTPKLDGQWVEGGAATQLLFKPKKPLTVGKYYTVTLATAAGTIGKDFLVAEDPAITALFPKDGTEADEKSSISVVFNRPMVPLTTLNVLDTKTIPLEINPPTKGSFKWLGTHTLQFIPDDHLIRSAHYTVRIKDGLKSVENLPITGATSAFTTRNLRYAYTTEPGSQLIYNQPIAIHFNQPVDLKRTAPEISLHDATTDKNVTPVVEYGTNRVYNEAKKITETIVDSNTLFIYPEKDSHGRAKLWDFTHGYHFKIHKAYPAEGDINLEEARELDVYVTDIIKSISATSPRSTKVGQTLFDPEGTLVVEFYEPVNLKASTITAPNLKNITYGEKCQAESVIIYADNSETTCPKESDETKLILTFETAKILKGTNIPLDIKKIVTKEGVTITTAPIRQDLKVIPNLALLRTSPMSAATSTPLTELILCTNSPLAIPGKEDLSDRFQATPAYEFKRWRGSELVPLDASMRSGFFCQAGEFETRLDYGLVPDTDYTLKLHLLDEFGSDTRSNLSFHTGPIDSYYLNFFHLQQEYNVTTPKNTTLTYAVENMEYVNLNICRLSADSMLQHLEHKPGYKQSPATITDCQNTITKQIPLPKRYWIKNYFTVDLKNYVDNPIGHYILTFSHPNYRDQFRTDQASPEVYERTYVTVTNLGIVEKKLEVWDNAQNVSDPENFRDSDRKKLQNLYWVTDLNTLQGVPNAKIDLYTGAAAPVTSDRPGQLTKAVSFTTDEQGIGKTVPLTRLEAGIVTVGGDSAFTFGDNKFGFNGYASTMQRIYLYTDRPIYRPGHEVDFKGWYRVGYDGAYEILKNKPISLKVFDPSGKEIYNQNLPVSDFGTFTGKFTLEATAPLGSYRLEANERGYGYFDVEEYVPSPFEVKATTKQEEYISGDTINLNVSANYYFGAPVSGGTVDYAFVSQDYYFDKYADKYFQFGSSWYDCYDSCRYGDRYLVNKTATLDQSGQATISEPLDLSRFFANESDRASKIIAVYITVKNNLGQTVSTQKSFILHAGTHYLGLRSDAPFLAKNQAAKLELKTVTTNGKPTSISNISLVYNKVRYAYNKRQEVDGGYYYNWERKLEPVKQTILRTDRSGDASDSFTPPSEGEYEVVARSTDERGNVVMSRYSLYVYGPTPVDVQPTNDTSLDLVADKTDLEVGDTASFIIKSPYPTAKALISVERGGIYDYKIVDIKQNLYRYTFPITEKYIPNVYVSVVLLSNKPEIKYGQLSFSVNTKRKELNLKVTSDKTTYLPGEDVTLSFEATDDDNRPVSAEFSAAVVDMSVLALKGNPKKTPVLFFYDGFPLTVSTLSNVKNILYKVDIPNGTKGGGGGSADLAAKKRGEFKDTAFWQGTLVTDSAGRAIAHFKLPDNLTTWQVEALAITKDTKVGSAYNEFVAKKDLMVVPLKPRFALPGDSLSVGANIFNQTDKSQKVTVTFTSSDLALIDKKPERQVTIGARQTATAYFAVTAPSNRLSGNLTFTIAAANGSVQDAVEQSLPLLPNTTYETTATASYTTAATTTEYVYLPQQVLTDRGELTVKTSATLAVFLTDGLKYLLQFPYGSSEEIASKLEGLAAAKRLSALKNLAGSLASLPIIYNGQSYTIDQAIGAGLTDLLKRQNGDGGFSYYLSSDYHYYEFGGTGYYGQQSNFYVSMYVGNALGRLRAAGVAVPAETTDKLYRYLVTEFAAHSYYQYYDNDIVLADTLTKLNPSASLPRELTIPLQKVVTDKKYLQDSISNLSLATLARLAAGQPRVFSRTATENLYKLLNNRLAIDSRGAYLDYSTNGFWLYYETPIRNTALYVEALVAGKQDTAGFDRVIRWLMASRSKDGAWGSTANTVSVVSALTDYLVDREEAAAKFSLSTWLDNVRKNLVTYADKTVSNQTEQTIPLSELAPGKLHNLTFQKTNLTSKNNTLYYDLALKYYLPIEVIPPRDEGFTITRNFYRVDDKDNVMPVTKGKVGDILRVHGEIIVPRWRNNVAIEDFIPAGAEIINSRLDTENQNLYQTDAERYQNAWRDLEPKAVYPFPSVTEEIRDDRYYAVAENLSEGTYGYDFYIRLLVPGTFHQLPAVVSEQHFPENFGRTSGRLFTIER